MHTSTSIPIQYWLFRKVKQWFNQQKKQGQKSIKIKATPQTVIVCWTGKDSFHIKERNKSGCFVFCLYPWDHVRHIAVKSSYLNEYFPPLVHCISTKLLKVSKTVDAEKKKKKKKSTIEYQISSLLAVFCQSHSGIHLNHLSKRPFWRRASSVGSAYWSLMSSTRVIYIRVTSTPKN